MGTKNNHLSGSTLRLFKEFKSLDIACEAVSGQTNLIRHQTKSGYWLCLKGMVSEKLPLFSYLLANDKWWTHEFLAEQQIPVPRTVKYESELGAVRFMERHTPVVAKPKIGAHGNGITLNIRTKTRLNQAVKAAKSFNPTVLLQQQLEGADVRLLLVGGKLISALERIPASVVGDGKHTLRRLIELENTKNSDRGVVGVHKLVKISEPAYTDYLSPPKLDSVPQNGQSVRVVGPSNHSLGGSIRDVIDTLDPIITGQAEVIARRLQMPIAGVDCIIADTGHRFIEINASPGIGIHDDNLVGIKSGCFRAYAQLLYNQEA